MYPVDLPFDIGDRVVIGANDLGAPEDAVGRVVRIENSGGEYPEPTYDYFVRVPTTPPGVHAQRQNFDWRVPATVLTAEAD